ncbi:hypothetical protein RRG08_064607 [Elysia crispata]|uniref:Uncharacterized protein n=1 Tax=Elysia crispata TaxID=231223 RepID=A0AAE1B988_9GAST|nr:hypothetical protein RRG08_064607 [Elysia crispata]
MKQISIQINRQTGQQTDRLFILLTDRLQYELIGERLDPLTHKKIPHHTQIIEKEYNYFKRGNQIRAEVCPSFVTRSPRCSGSVCCHHSVLPVLPKSVGPTRGNKDKTFSHKAGHRWKQSSQTLIVFYSDAKAGSTYRKYHLTRLAIQSVSTATRFQARTFWSHRLAGAHCIQEHPSSTETDRENNSHVPPHGCQTAIMPDHTRPAMASYWCPECERPGAVYLLYQSGQYNRPEARHGHGEISLITLANH